MQQILFFPPARIKVSSHKIATLIEDLDYRRLPETSEFKYFGQQRRAMRVEVSELSYKSLVDHCNYYGKSFSTVIMQALTLKGGLIDD